MMITGSVVMRSLGWLARHTAALIPEHSSTWVRAHIHVILSKLYFKQSQIILLTYQTLILKKED